MKPPSTSLPCAGPWKVAFERTPSPPKWTPAGTGPRAGRPARRACARGRRGYWRNDCKALRHNFVLDAPFHDLSCIKHCLRAPDELNGLLECVQRSPLWIPTLSPIQRSCSEPKFSRPIHFDRMRLPEILASADSAQARRSAAEKGQVLKKAALSAPRPAPARLRPRG